MSIYKEFRQLCEGCITEASTGLTQFTDPYAKELITYLHRSKAFGHDVDYQKVPRITWQNMKDNTGRWFLIDGENGWVAVVHDNNRYKLYIANGTKDPEDDSFVMYRIAPTATVGNELIKKTIGRPQAFYYVNSQYSQNLSARRNVDKTKIDALSDRATVQYLVTRFKPLFERLIVQARADIKGVLGNMVKSDAHHAVDKKISKIRYLDSALEMLKQGQVNDYLVAAVNNAVVMAAGYYYPEETGKIEKLRYGAKVLTAENDEGKEKLLSDIGNGDKDKLSGVLAYLKRILVL